MCNLMDMNYEELVDLDNRVTQFLKRWRPVRIRKLWKRCGKSGCVCHAGPADGSWGNLHGPYLYARYTDAKTGRARCTSLGKFFDADDINEVLEQSLDWSKYFTVGQAEYDRLSPQKQQMYGWRYNLDGLQFKEFYGLSPDEDLMGRNKTYWGTEANYNAFQSKRRELDEKKEAALDEWSIMYGIGSPVGQKVLREILKREYYLAS